MKRRKLAPDNRLDWRDPDMPCIRTGVINRIQQTAPIDPKHIQRYYDAKMDSANMLPEWRNDPSYFWSRKK